MDRAAQLAGPMRRGFLRSAAALGGLGFVPSAFAGGTGLVRPTTLWTLARLAVCGAN